MLAGRKQPPTCALMLAGLCEISATGYPVHRPPRRVIPPRSERLRSCRSRGDQQRPKSAENGYPAELHPTAQVDPDRTFRRADFREQYGSAEVAFRAEATGVMLRLTPSSGN